MTRILMLDLMHKQMKNHRVMPGDVVLKVNQELENLVSPSVTDSIQSYLISKNGKKMKGTEHIWKYRLNDGDRILYTYGRYLPCLHNSEGSTLVLLGYAKHDDQGFFAKAHHFEYETKYLDVAEYVRHLHDVADTENIAEIAPEDLYTIAEILSPSYLREHAAYIVSGEQIANLSAKELEMNPVLSPEQAKFVDSFYDNPRPTLVLGGAGTGKTLISIHVINNYMAFNETGERAAYFTQSKELRSSVEKRYRIVSEADEIPSMFFGINEYCMEKLERSNQMSNLITYSRFVIDIFYKLPDSLMKQCTRFGIDQLAAWTEIRGIIKGQLDHEWRRNSAVSQIDIPGNINVGKLVQSGWFKRKPDEQSKIILADSIDTTSRKLHETNNLSSAEKNAVNYVLNYFSHIDSKMIDIGKSVYLNLTGENTTLDIEQRKILWQVYEVYKSYLISHNLFDDNDLARETIRLIDERNIRIEKFGLIVIDEIQDYTELQILLLSSLSSNRKFIIYAGDANQNVNPTLFREEKLQRLYKDDSSQKSTLDTIYLTGNYRCPKETVSVTNRLANLRRELVACGKAEREQDETSGREGTIPYRLKYNDTNLRLILEEMMRYPRTAFLVPDELTKNEIISFLGVEKYQENGVPFVHTVSEIKGMEYAYVVCFDLFGRYINTWNKMLSMDHKKKSTGERYFFNLPYVAMTRTQQHLGIIDKTINEEVECRLNLESVDRFDSISLYFDTLDSDEETWLQAARESEDKGKYEDAAELYKKAGASFKEIRRCNAKHMAELGNYYEAVKSAFVARDTDTIFGLVEQLDKKTELSIFARALLFLGKLEDVTINMNNLIDSIFSENFSLEEITEVRLFCVSLLDDLINRYVDQTEDWISDFDV